MHPLPTRLTPTLSYFLLFACWLMPFSLTAQEKFKGAIEIEGETRKYRLFIPATYTADEPIPLVFNLHGITSDPGQQQLLTQMNKVATENSFIVCYPKGKNRAWNVNFPFPSSKADDVEFISRLIDSLKAAYNIDLNRVYACGFSNGGYMSHKLACELSDKIVAIASVAGTFVPKEAANCHPDRAVPILQIHGRADPIVPYNGGLVALSVEKTLAFWANKNDCSEEITITNLANKVKLDFSRATKYDFEDCADQSAVVLYKVKNGGHTWPGTKIITGVTNQDFEASTEIWHFFQQFSFDEPTMFRNRPAITATPKVSPNPTYLDVNIELTLSEPTVLSRGLYNLQGQTVLNKESQDFPAGIVNWHYSLQNIPAGIYFLKLQNGNSVYTRKVILKR